MTFLSEIIFIFTSSHVGWARFCAHAVSSVDCVGDSISTFGDGEIFYVGTKTCPPYMARIHRIYRPIETGSTGLFKTMNACPRYCL
jgi:hypothetical protein